MALIGSQTLLIHARVKIQFGPTILKLSQNFKSKLII